MKIFYLLPLLVLASCANDKQKTGTDRPDSLSIPDMTVNNQQMLKLRKLWVQGEFDGDPGKDTIRQHTFSGVSGREIDAGPDPKQVDQPVIENWYANQKSDVYLSFKEKGKDTLHFDGAQGLYCLLNVGDNNGDGKDEIALVVNGTGQNRVNRCFIYTLCDREWTIIKDFGVHEDAFSFEGAEAPVFTEIKDHLEQHDGKWVYKGYPENAGIMTALLTDKCIQR